MIAIGIGGIVNREDHRYAPGVSVIVIDRGSESSSATGGEVTPGVAGAVLQTPP